MKDHLQLALSEKIKEVLRNYIGYLSVGLVCLSYIATSFVTIGETGKGIGEILADGVVAFLLGIMINRMFDAQGLRNGDRDARVCIASERHARIAERVAPCLDELDEWCEIKNREALARARRQYLSRHGMRYTDYFMEDGTPYAYLPRRGGGLRARREELLRHIRFRRAAAIRLTRLSAGLLISDTGNPDDPYYLGRSKTEYTRESSRRDFLTKLFTAILFGYYGVSLLGSFSPADLIWTLFQVGIFLLMGGVKMEQSYLYVTDEYRARMTKKADILRMFENSRRKGENVNDSEIQGEYEDRGENAELYGGTQEQRRDASAQEIEFG
ncbi:MAG: hypothetical protein E7643_01445 [Ruminococcaceae bacterium]|nr:hypothetical protein [Oscillospiraceae bacterium]